MLNNVPGMQRVLENPAAPTMSRRATVWYDHRSESSRPTTQVSIVFQVQRYPPNSYQLPLGQRTDLGLGSLDATTAH